MSGNNYLQLYTNHDYKALNYEICMNYGMVITLPYHSVLYILYHRNYT